MSSLAPTKRDHPTNTLPSKQGLLAWLKPYLTSTIGQKVLVALTGTMLVGFVIAHLIGNLKIFGGPDSLNTYGAFLKSLGPLLWVMRFGLLAAFLLHLTLALKLRLTSDAARPVEYQFQNTIQASLASRTMPQTGLVILAFVIYHLAHYTFGMTQATPDGKSLLDLRDPLHQDRHDIYRMTVLGFQNPYISAIYLVAQGMLAFHLSHGIASVFQTLGLSTPRLGPMFKCLAWTISLAILVGNSAIVLAVWLGFVA